MGVSRLSKRAQAKDSDTVDDALLLPARARCPRGHEVAVEATSAGWATAQCDYCSAYFEYLGDVKCARSNNNTKRLRGKTRRFDVRTTITFRTPNGESEQQRMVLQGIRPEPRELVHLRQPHRFSSSRGRSGIYHVANYTVGEQWNLLRPFSWVRVALRLALVLLVAWWAGQAIHDAFNTSITNAVIGGAVVGVLLVAVIGIRYWRRHAIPKAK
jgi:hypothetical protein